MNSLKLQREWLKKLEKEGQLHRGLCLTPWLKQIQRGELTHKEMHEAITNWQNGFLKSSEKKQSNENQSVKYDHTPMKELKLDREKTLAPISKSKR
jgi:hypothetical protein